MITYGALRVMRDFIFYVVPDHQCLSAYGADCLKWYLCYSVRVGRIGETRIVNFLGREWRGCIHSHASQLPVEEQMTLTTLWGQDTVHQL
jgi:hypothetical protein